MWWEDGRGHGEVPEDGGASRDLQDKPVDVASAASQASKVVSASRASGPGSRTSPAISTLNRPPRQLGTSWTDCPRAVGVRRVMSTRS